MPRAALRTMCHSQSIFAPLDISVVCQDTANLRVLLARSMKPRLVPYRMRQYLVRLMARGSQREAKRI